VIVALQLLFSVCILWTEFIVFTINNWRRRDQLVCKRMMNGVLSYDPSRHCANVRRSDSGCMGVCLWGVTHYRTGYVEFVIFYCSLAVIGEPFPPAERPHTTAQSRPDIFTCSALPLCRSSALPSGTDHLRAVLKCDERMTIGLGGCGTKLQLVIYFGISYCRLNSIFSIILSVLVYCRSRRSSFHSAINPSELIIMPLILHRLENLTFLRMPCLAMIADRMQANTVGDETVASMRYIP